MHTNKYAKEQGITLIALAVTIVVLLILAGVSLNAVFGQNGIIGKAQEAQNKMDAAENSDLTAINNLNQEMENWINGNGGTGNPEENKHPGELITLKSTGKAVGKELQADTVTAQDTLGNQVVIPGKFKIADDSGATVKEGIVIEDEEGNQFVWVPVSNINNDGSNKIKVDENTEVEITLGRYTFDEADGTPELKQAGENYASTVSIGSYDDCAYQELSTYRESTQDETLTSTNTTAKDLKTFVEKTAANKGYYIARYEASYGSGYNSSGSTDKEKYANAKPLSKVSEGFNGISMNYDRGTLWNFITQGNAATVCQNMYRGNAYVESDLTNSYAWDTAIVYIQAMGNSNYANQVDGNSKFMNTGETEDEKCKIFDMAGHQSEWTTEYCSYTLDDYYTLPCIAIGGRYNDRENSTVDRFIWSATSFNNLISFRATLYVK